MARRDIVTTDVPCLKKGDLIDVKAKIYFCGKKYYHLVYLTVNGTKMRSDVTQGSDYWKTVLALLDERLDSKTIGSPTQKLWYLKDMGVKFDSCIVNVNNYNDLD
jgi:hypothetical protein